MDWPGEDIELKVADVVVASEVDRGLERHCFQTRRYCMHLKSKYPWWLYASWHFSWNNKYNFDVGDKDDDNDDDDLIEGESEHQWTSDDDDAAAADDVDDDDDDADDANDDNVHLIESEPEHLPGNNCPLSKGGSPEVGGITAI